MELLTFCTKNMIKICCQSLVQKINKNTYRLFALNNLVNFQTFFGAKTSVLIKFLHLITNEMQLDHFAFYAN